MIDQVEPLVWAVPAGLKSILSSMFKFDDPDNCEGRIDSKTLLTEKIERRRRVKMGSEARLPAGSSRRDDEPRHVTWAHGLVV